MIWFNPPWNDEVSTNVAMKFLSMIIDRHFPKGSTLGKHFNRSTVEVRSGGGVFNYQFIKFLFIDTDEDRYICIYIDKLIR